MKTLSKAISVASFFAVASFSSIAFGQNAPAIHWQKSYGGTMVEVALAARATTDGGYIVGGSSYSNDKDVSGHHGSTDFSDGWIIKLDANGKLQWQHSYGGSNDDEIINLALTHDGGYIFVGATNSVDGDCPGHHGNEGNSDVWVVKLSSSGDTEWTRSLGGTGDESGASIVQTADLGYIIACNSTSNDGDLTTHHGSADSSDVWIVKLDQNGKTVWQHSYGGTNHDVGGSVVEIPGAGYLVLCTSSSTDGDATGHHGPAGNSDLWLLGLDLSGNLISQKQIGSTGSESAMQIVRSADGNFFISALIDGGGGDLSAYKSTDSSHHDMWIAKISALGDILWQNAIIAITESPSCLVATSDSGAIFCGFLYPSDSSLTRTDSAIAVVAKCNKAGAIEWQGSFPGGIATGATALLQVSANTYLFAGLESGIGRDVTAENGNGDFWVVEFGAPTNGVEHSQSLASSDAVAYPNPASERVTISLPIDFGTSEHSVIRLYNSLGEEVRQTEIPIASRSATINSAGLPVGAYYYRIVGTAGKTAEGRVVVR